MTERWLTMDEAALELRTTPAAIRRMIKKKQLVAVQVQRAEAMPGAYRILDPSQKLRQSLLEPELERFPCITFRDLAEILGLSAGVLRWHVHVGNLKPTSKKSTKTLSLFTPKDVRKFLARYERRRGPGMSSYSGVIVRWLRTYLDELKPNADVLDELLKAAVLLPEPRRSELVVRLWALFDEVNLLLKEATKESGTESPRSTNP